MKSYDFTIIGGGIYGMYAATILSKKNKVLLIDADDDLFSRATYVNQARLHNGYHYPRSLETAKQANLYFERFQKDYEESVYREFDQIYAIAAKDSNTSLEGYIKFCQDVGIPLEEVDASDLFIPGAMAKSFSTKEHAFDYKKVLTKMLKGHTFDIKQKTIITSSKIFGQTFSLALSTGEIISTGGIINATYSSLNQVNHLFNTKMADMKYELCELVLCRPPSNFDQRGITVMDGEFFSCMPFGKKDLYSLWSVRHSVAETSWEDLPKFKCQTKSTTCNKYQLNNCNSCLVQPSTLFPKMKERVSEFLINPDITYLNSLFTVKAIAKEAEGDDSRLVYFHKESSLPYYAHVFSGKINCIYELDEKLKEFL